MRLEEQLPEGFEGRDGILNKFSDVEGLAKSYQELQRNMGGSIRLPSPESSQEEHNEFFQRLGTPESAEGYEVPEGMEEWAESAKDVAFSANLTQDQWYSLMEAQSLSEETASSAHDESLESSSAAIKEHYGSDYEASLELAQVAINALSEDNPVLAEALKTADLRDQATFELFGIVGGLLSDGSTPETMAHGETEETDDVDTAMRCRELMKSKAFTDKRDPEHEKIKTEYYKKFQALLQKGYEGVSDPRLKTPGIF